VREALALPTQPRRAVLLRRLRIREGHAVVSSILLAPAAGFGEKPLVGLKNGVNEVPVGTKATWSDIIKPGVQASDQASGCDPSQSCRVTMPAPPDDAATGLDRPRFTRRIPIIGHTQRGGSVEAPLSALPEVVSVSASGARRSTNLHQRLAHGLRFPLGEAAETRRPRW
jgi:hypothetical protein